MVSPTVPLESDGRRARAARGRDAVVEAILDLLNEGVESPGGAQIAERAGVSVRSVFRYFEDLEALHVAAIDRHVERSALLFAPPDRSGDLATRATALVASRARLFEGIAPVRRVAERLRGRSPSIETRLAEARSLLRSAVEAQFADELAALDADRRAAVLDALDVATSWAAWEHLRRDQGCPVPRAEAAMLATVRGLLGLRA